MFDRKIYIDRRETLRRKVSSGIILFLGNSNADINYQGNSYPFRQDSSFVYYFGLMLPDMAAVMDVDTGEEIIFGNDVDVNDIVWTGPQPLVRELADSVGASSSRTLAALEEYLCEALRKNRKIHFLPPYRHQTKMELNRLLGIPFAAMEDSASEELIKAVIDMRLVKKEEEIAELENAAEIGYRMHYAVMRSARLGMKEQELAGLMDGIAMQYGRMTSFPTILSQNGETLHNETHNQILTDGRIIVIDAGAEALSGYVSDFTRSIPSSGKFNSRQKDIYQIVESANEYFPTIARSGESFESLHLKVARLMLEGLKGLGLVKGDLDEAVSCGVQGLFMPHGLSHHIGLDVHDLSAMGKKYMGFDDTYRKFLGTAQPATAMGKTFKTGYVVSNEPGIYFIPALLEQCKRERKNEAFVNFSAL
ncbi:MAG: aminopeptidase P N-terminal domain-containing protein, partial [Alistipes sp.]|nr:aminopeptidase P N-terminal domain-containing protein [Candidatus Minthomonas equi]